MALLDSDNFIVSDTSGTNYRINASALAAYINAQASGGGSGNVAGISYPFMVMEVLVGRDLRTPRSYRLWAHGSHYGATTNGNVDGYSHNIDKKRTIGVRAPTSTAQLGLTMPDPETFFEDLFVANELPDGDTWRVALTIYGGKWDMNESYVTDKIGAKHVQTLDLVGGAFYMGNRSIYTALTTINGEGIIGPVDGIPNLHTVGIDVQMGNPKGTVDFSETSVSAETISMWLSKLDWETSDHQDQYHKVLRFEGGSAETYEDLPQSAKDRITELQDLGYTIVMNGTGDSSTVNIGAGNVATIIETSDNRYIPVAASTTTAIFPPTNYANKIDYGTLAAAKTAMDNQVSDFDPDILFGEIQASIPAYTGVVEVAIGDPVTLTVPTITNPESATISYQWFKEIDGENQIIESATDATIQTNSVTSDKLGAYGCEVLLTHTASGRSRTLTVVFEVREPEQPLNTLTLIGSGAVDSVAVNASGSGYSDFVGAATTGGSGSGLTVNITTAGGAITAANVYFPGEGYVDGETVTVAAGDNNATLDVTIN